MKKIIYIILCGILILSGCSEQASAKSLNKIQDRHDMMGRSDGFGGHGGFLAQPRYAAAGG